MKTKIHLKIFSQNHYTLKKKTVNIINTYVKVIVFLDDLFFLFFIFRNTISESELSYSLILYKNI